MDEPEKPRGRTRPRSADLRAAWSANATSFITWARKPGHDSYWRFHRDQFFELVPPPGRRTLDVGCGEGRLSRDLRRLGHSVIGIDASSEMIDAARDLDPSIEAVVADAAGLPFADGSFDCVVAFMSLQDIDDFAGAIREAARVLERGGRFVLAIVHPLNSAGAFVGEEPDSEFTISGSYLTPSYYTDCVARDGLEIEFVSAHRPLEAYCAALSDAGLLIETLREPAVPSSTVTGPRSLRWQRLPLFLHLRSLRP